MNISGIKNEVLGKAIAKARHSSGLSQAALGEIIGVDSKTVSTYERGTRRIHGTSLLKLAKALSMSLDQLLDMEFPRMDGRTRHARTLKELEKVEQLPKDEQRVVFTLIDSLADKQEAVAK